MLNVWCEKLWYKMMVGEVVKEIVVWYSLKVVIGKDVVEQVLDYLDQINESDVSFLMKLVCQYGVIVLVKDSNLLFIWQGQGRIVSGKVLLVIIIICWDGDSYCFSMVDRGVYIGVIVYWLYMCELEKKEIIKVKCCWKMIKLKELEVKQGDYLIGMDENVLVLNWIYVNCSNVECVVKMNWEWLQCGVVLFFLQLVEGCVDFYMEMFVKVIGFK